MEAKDQYFGSSSAACRMWTLPLTSVSLSWLTYKTQLKDPLTFSTLQGQYEDQEYHVHERNLQPYSTIEMYGMKMTMSVVVFSPQPCPI